MRAALARRRRVAGPWDDEVAEDCEEAERGIYFMEACKVFDVEQIEGSPAHFYSATPQPEPATRITSTLCSRGWRARPARTRKAWQDGQGVLR